MAEHHITARAAFKRWVDSGRPRHGPIFEEKKLSNAKFKYAVRSVKRQENTMRADSLASKLQSKDLNDFWKEVKVMNNSKTSLPASIEDACSPVEIAELWRKHYFKLFNCVNGGSVALENVDPSENVLIRSDDVFDAIRMLDINKASGIDQITAEHLKFAGKKVCPLLAMCFTGLLVHGVLPESSTAVQLVPVLKDKAGKLNSIDNYRPIALASILSKVLERILLTRLEMFIITADNQFGFKKKHGTDLCIFALKEMIDSYSSRNSTVFLCFIDASCAFDRINHAKLFQKLLDRGIPKYIVRILMFWYANQKMLIKWGNVTSSPFSVSNGVR